MYKFVFASIDTPIEEIKNFFNEHNISYTLKNNGIFIIDLITIIVRDAELLATRGLLIELRGHNMFLRQQLDTNDIFKIQNVIYGWLNVD